MVGLFDLVLRPFVIIVVYKCFSTTSKDIGILNLCHGNKVLILWDYNSAIVTILRKITHYSWDNSDTWNIIQKHIVLINFLAEKQRVLSLCSHQIILSWWIHQPRNSKIFYFEPIIFILWWMRLSNVQHQELIFLIFKWSVNPSLLMQVLLLFDNLLMILSTRQTFFDIVDNLNKMMFWL